MSSYVSTQVNLLLTKMLYKERKNTNYQVQWVALCTSSGTMIKPSGKSMHWVWTWCNLKWCYTDIQYSIDATNSDRIGRFVHHSKHNHNAATKVVTVNSEPHLCLIAAQNIEIGEEVLYDYADNRQEVVKANPWLHWQNDYVHVQVLIM